MAEPPLVARAERLGVSCPRALGELVHLLAAQRGRARCGTASPALAAWMAAALPPGVPLFLSAPAPAELFADDPDVHLVETLDAEAPYDLLAGVDPAGLLVPGGTAVLLDGRAPDGLLALDAGPAVVAVRAL